MSLYLYSSLQHKPGIAHRDIKSKNILVRSDLSCVLADFGLAVTHFEGNSSKDNKRDSAGPSVQNNTDVGNLCFPMHQTKARVGTIRYMSPEELDLSIKEKTPFDVLCLSDMYSFALVMWEVLRRTDLPVPEIPGEPAVHALPYSESVDPTLNVGHSK